MIRLVIILASIILSKFPSLSFSFSAHTFHCLFKGDSVSSASEFLICHCHNTNCFSNKTCQVPLSNGGCFVETSREKGSPLTFGCCINDHILSECKLYLRAYCQSGDYCNRDLQPVSITSGTEDSRNGPTLPPLTLPTESSNNATTNSTQPTDNGQSESTAES